MLTIKEVKKYSEILTKNKIKCKCGHSVLISPNKDKIICQWCGNYVFKNEKLEFKFRVKEIINKVKGK